MAKLLALPVALGVACAVVQPAAAQQTRPLVQPPEFGIDQWTTEDGLTQNSVNAIAQAPGGYLWVGTFGGLMRFDGTSFRLQERVDSAGRHVDRVLSLAVGPDSVLWIGTENGLLRYKHNRYRLYTTADGLADNTIPSLHVDRTGALWIGAQRGGITRYAEGQFQTFREIDGVPFDFVNSFVEDGDGTLWVNTVDRFVAMRRETSVMHEWPATSGLGARRTCLCD